MESRDPQQPDISESYAEVIRDRFMLFSLFWGWATLIDLGKWWAKNLNDPLLFCVFASACLVCLRPASACRLVLLVFLTGCTSYWQLPWLSNHGICSAFASITMLVCLVPSALKCCNGRYLRDGVVMASARMNIEWWRDWFQRFAPVLRWQAVLCYAIAAFHKLNTDFFDPDKSCAVILWQRMIRITPWAETLSSFGFAMPVVALATELVLPLLLLRSRNRLIVVVFGLSFHLALGLAGFFRFSSLATALYVLFLPDWVLASARSTIDSLRNKLPEFLANFGSSNLQKISSSIVLIVAVLALFSLPYSPTRSTLSIRELSSAPVARYSLWFQGLWLLPTIGILVYLVWLLSVCDLKVKTRPRIDRLGWLSIFPILFALNGLSPYLGLKTVPSLSMFSNLRTVGNTSNHLVVRFAAQVIPDGADLVAVVSTTDPVLNSLRDKNYELAWIEVCSYVQARIDQGDDFQLKYRRNGVVKDVKSVKAAGEDFVEAFWLKRRLVRYRPVSKATVCPCIH